MVATVADFVSCLRRGQEGEEFLDKFMSRWYGIARASAEDEQAGIDRVFKIGNREITVEYKTDSRAAETGRFYLEVLSHSVKFIPGWVYSSAASMIVIYAPSFPQWGISSFIYCLETQKLRRKMPRWEANFPLVKVPNKNYFGMGRLIPRQEVVSVASAVLEVKP